MRSTIWIGTLLAVTVVALFVRLGLWQLNRAEQKRAEREFFERQGEAPAVVLDDLLDLPLGRLAWRSVTVTGSYLPGVNVVLENQSYGGRAGYLVYSPLRLRAAPRAVLVNRGWVPSNGRRDTVAAAPASEDLRTLQAVVGEPPAQGVQLKGADHIERLSDGVLRVQQIDYARLGELIGLRLEPYVLLLDPREADGFVRDWASPGGDASRHESYAFQWFAMASALIVIYAVLVLRRRR